MRLPCLGGQLYVCLFVFGWVWDTGPSSLPSTHLYVFCCTGRLRPRSCTMNIKTWSSCMRIKVQLQLLIKLTFSLWQHYLFNFLGRYKNLLLIDVFTIIRHCQVSSSYRNTVLSATSVGFWALYNFRFKRSVVINFHHNTLPCILAWTDKQKICNIFFSTFLCNRKVGAASN